MMATTHVFAGLAVVAPVAYVSPEFAAPLAVGAIVGGLAPDLDLPFEHRRSFHFPVVGLPVAVLAVGLAVFATSSATVTFAAVAVVAWLHAASDALGDGPEMDPWTSRGDRAVYDHARSRWIRPRRWIRYDGAPEDGVAAVVLAVPPLLVFEGWIAALVVGGIAVSIVYVLLRRRLVAWLPEWLE
ncbi:MULTISPECIES: metal-dependent hydrolase [Natrialbaceae]|uniref:metal-dependent hydrolase n=1 Tax=Natrialbaceae TaxID=1644061 RepID=UPI00207D1403|nr:metal-dependent hydrolase [Natronococcus sp. CG52]